MKVVILAGGFGTRLAEYTDVIPKPMVQVGSKPIIWHIMNWYASYGFNDFYIALGYKAEVIKKYFLDLGSVGRDFTINLRTREVEYYNSDIPDWKVTLVDTGISTMTGGRIKRLSPFVNDAPFLLTYGDGIANVNLKKLVNFHHRNEGLVTVTAVRPQARFGELQLKSNLVQSFKEKPHTNSGWINGGFFVIDPKFLDYIDDDSTVLEASPLERCANEGALYAYKHQGFWQCMDTKRDQDALNHLAVAKTPPWCVKEDS